MRDITITTFINKRTAKRSNRSRGWMKSNPNGDGPRADVLAGGVGPAFAGMLIWRTLIVPFRRLEHGGEGSVGERPTREVTVSEGVSATFARS